MASSVSFIRDRFFFYPNAYAQPVGVASPWTYFKYFYFNTPLLGICIYYLLTMSPLKRSIRPPANSMTWWGHPGEPPPQGESLCGRFAQEASVLHGRPYSWVRATFSEYPSTAVTLSVQAKVRGVLCQKPYNTFPRPAPPGKCLLCRSLELPGTSAIEPWPLPAPGWFLSAWCETTQPSRKYSRS